MRSWPVSSRKTTRQSGGTSRVCVLGMALTGGKALLDADPLDLIEAPRVAAAIVELRRAGRGMVRHRRSLFEGAAVLEIGGDPGRPEAVIAELGFNPSRRRAPTDHRIGVRLRQHGARELAGASADRAEQRPLGIVAQARAVEI